MVSEEQWRLIEQDLKSMKVNAVAKKHGIAHTTIIRHFRHSPDTTIVQSCVSPDAQVQNGAKQVSPPEPPPIKPAPPAVTPEDQPSASLSALRQQAQAMNSTTDARQEALHESSGGPIDEGYLDLSKPVPAHEFAALFTLIRQLDQRISYLEYMLKKGTVTRQECTLGDGESVYEPVNE